MGFLSWVLGDDRPGAEIMKEAGFGGKMKRLLGHVGLSACRWELSLTELEA